MSPLKIPAATIRMEEQRGAQAFHNGVARALVARRKAHILDHVPEEIIDARLRGFDRAAEEADRKDGQAIEAMVGALRAVSAQRFRRAARALRRALAAIEAEHRRRPGPRRNARGEPAQRKVTPHD